MTHLLSGCESVQDPEIQAICLQVPGFIIWLLDHALSSLGQFLRGEVAATPVGASNICRCLIS